MRILITGGSGFIGTHLIKKLSNDGHDIYNLDKISSPSLPSDKQKIIDILDIDVNDVFFDNIDTIIHLAGMVSVPKSFEDPINSFGNNTFCTIKLLSAAHLHKIKKFIFSSSAAVYGSKEGAVSETDAAEPNSPYGLDKLASEKYIQMYCQQWDIDYLILRLFNIYGQGQNPQYAGVITAFNMALEKKESLIIYGDGEQTRDFITVNDVCNHISKLVSSTIKNEIFNIGTGNSISINTLAKQFGSNIIYKEAKKEVRHSCANIQKIKNYE
jgi:nucleoside-diphosphate-sugar epimerase